MQLPFLARAKPRVRVPSINLYPEDPFYDTLLGRALRWAVSAGRHIVIFTELIVIGSFFSRFILDRQLTDLNRSIVQKQAIVESYGDLEEKVRTIQMQTKDIATILQQQGRYQALQILTEVTPPDVTYSQITLTGDRMSIQGKTLSNRSLSVLIEGLRHRKEMQSVSINEIQSGDVRDPGVNFSVSVVYQQGLAAATAEAAGKKPAQKPSAEDAETEK